jgi:RimJ/RimL family protein N-acetyltransferase
MAVKTTNDMKTEAPQLLDPQEIELAAPLIRASEFGPYQYLKLIKNADYKGYTFFKLRELGDDDQTQFYVVPGNGNIGGLASLKSLPWDEQIFKMKMATIPHLLTSGSYEEQNRIASKLICKIIEECQSREIKHISVRIDNREMAAIHALEENGFKLMDILTYNLLDMNIVPHKTITAPYILREFQSEDIDDIMEVARQGFTDYVDRFHLDPGFSHSHSDDLYAEWARNSCLGYADNVFVAEKDKTIIGFITAKIHRDVEEYTKLRLGEIPLVVIPPESRRLGFFPNLVDCCMNWLKHHADMTLAKTLINNFQVQRICQNLGFKLAQTQCTFHKRFE